MHEGQINSLKQSKDLFEIAKTDKNHLELAKYLVINMNSISYALSKGWLDKATESDIEYASKYVNLRDEYYKILFNYQDSTSDENYSPKLGTPSELLNAIKCGYDFSSETGKLILSSIYINVQNSISLSSHSSNEISEVMSELNKLKNSI